MTEQQPPPVSKPSVSTNGQLQHLGLVAIVGQAGCVALLVIFVALLIGLGLDSLVGRRGLCTVGLMVMSIPFSLYAMVQVALRAVAKIQPLSPKRGTDYSPPNTRRE